MEFITCMVSILPHTAMSFSLDRERGFGKKMEI